MNRTTFLLPLLVAVAACSSPPPAKQVVERTNEVSLGFERVLRKPDVAAYPSPPEHVFAVQPTGRDFVVVRVANYPKQRLLPPPVLTHAPVSPVAQAQPPKAPPVETVEFKVHFPTASHALDSAARQSIDANLPSSPGRRSAATVLIDGHTDSVGSAASNQRLSDRRAAAVRDYLIKKGIAPSSILTHGHGEDQPAASNETTDGRAMNRRADIRLKSQEP